MVTHNDLLEASYTHCPRFCTFLPVLYVDAPMLFVHHSFLSQHFPTKIHIKIKAYPLKKEAMNIIIVILVLGN